MRLVPLLALAVLAAPSLASAAEWEKYDSEDGVDVYTREVEGSLSRQVKAFGDFDGTPERVLAVLVDVESYPKTRRMVAETKVLKREGNHVWYYLRAEAPVVSSRDYVVKSTMSRLPDGRLKVEWTGKHDLAYPERPGVVRLSLVEGHWLLSPLDGGKRTRAVYFVHTDPKSDVPAFVVNRASAGAVPKIYAGIRKALASPQYANARSPLAEDAPSAP